MEILNSEEQRLLLVKQVRQFGDLNTDAILDSSCKIFSTPSVNGFIGYRTEANCAVAFGDPLCAPGDQLKLCEAFKSHCEQFHLTVIYAIVSKQFANSIINQCGSVSIQFGHKLILDPNKSPLSKTGSKGSLVRKKVRRALKEGLVIQEYTTSDASVENAITEMGNSWLKSRHGPQIYIADHNFFKDREGKRWFYAKQRDRIVGFLIMNKIQSGNAWLLNNLIITPEAPPGTSELLVTSTLEILKGENCKIVTGPVTAKEIDNIVGLGKLSSWLVRLSFKIAKNIFGLDKQTLFWDKFQPEIEPSYVLFDKVNFQTFKALLYAMNARI